MTNDYKDKLLKYLSGNLDKEAIGDNYYTQETNKEEFNEDMSATTNIIYCTDNQGNPNGKSIAYGVGVLLLFDENGNLLKKFTKYESGTSIGTITSLKVDESGNLYGIEGTYISDSRIIFLNNISEKGNKNDYECILRKTYFIQTSISFTGSNYSQCFDVIKSNQSAKYMIMWYYQDYTDNNFRIFGTELTVNVGMANDWNDYSVVAIPFTNSLNSYGFNVCTYYTSSDDPNILVYFMNYTNPQLKIYNIINTDRTLSYGTYLTNNINAGASGVSLNKNISINNNSFYLATQGQTLSGSNLTIHTRIYKIENNSIITIVSYDDVVTNNSYIIWLDNSNWLEKIDNLVFYTYQRPHGNSTTQFDTTYGIIPGTTEYDYTFTLEDISTYGINFVINKTFNIYTMIVIYENTASQYYKQTTKIIYNSNNYNGTDYENINSLVPRQGTLYDENNSLIFARNLYNYKVYNNRTISVLNVPNTFLNGENISNEQLLSDTNSTIVSNMQTINKNIYEDLYININNQITMQNQNENNYVDNLEGAIRLNQSSGKELDYDNAKANKIRVTYDDDTSYITMANNEINDNICTYTIGVHVPSNKNILKIDIISNDENTIYQSITNLNLANNKYYVITQDVHVV